MPGGDAAGNVTTESGWVGPGGATNVLVLSPTMDAQARQAYFERLVPDSPASLDVLAVNYRDSPDQWLDEWRRYTGSRPGRCAIVTVNESLRSTASSASDSGPTRLGPNTVACIESPRDLTGIGIRISEYLRSHGGPETLVTVDSLTVLLQYVEIKRAFRFLHVLAKRVESTDAIAHYHMDPDAHDDDEVETLASVFDTVVEFDGGGFSLRDG